ncbi:GntR family transcriptional regulator [Sphingobacteriaceae bacterium]|nr:GntR family transcriptional regulator [Sphingobacteriaceae bacterium]
MKTKFLNYLLLSLVFSLFAFAKKAENIKVYLIGDSTCAIKEPNKYPETGWGMPFVYFFDSSIVVDNRAKNGRSTRTFIEEKLWQPVVENLKEGDYVFIQFGHNDEVKTKKSYTTEEEFKKNLVRYITESKNKKALPILITPVARRKFDSVGVFVKTHEVYSAIVREVARQQQIPLIDLDIKSTELLIKMGVENSRMLFLQLAKGEHPNYPEGIEDNTHFNEFGARKIAQIVLEDIRKLNLPLAAHIVKPGEKK